MTALRFVIIVVTDFVVVVIVVIVNIIILVVAVIFSGSNAVAINVHIHGEGEAPYGGALINGDNLRVGGGDYMSTCPPPSVISHGIGGILIPAKWRDSLKASRWSKR